MVTNSEIKEIFNQYFDGDLNFITPNVYGYGVYHYDKDNLVVFEKSTNDTRTLYGASALLFNPNTNICKRIDLGQCFPSNESLNRYIDRLTKFDFEEAHSYGESKKIIF
jgi:hypothetical protein